MRHILRILLLTSLAVACGAPPTSSQGVDRARGALDASLKLITGGLSQPVAAMTAGDDSRRLFVVEQDGLIRMVKKGNLRPTPFLDITNLTNGAGEQGLLGLAFHPNYNLNRRFFVHYTALNGDTVIAEFKRAFSQRWRADESSERVLIRIDDPYSNHNGGDLHFGPDGYLYIGLGDGGGGGDPHENGQNLSTFLGKILRIDVDATEGDLEYAIPDDNPFVGVEGARDVIWSYGWRNPWRFSFDSATGDMWVADVGQDNFEEVNVERAGSPGGTNYGWDIMEADSCFEPADGCDQSGLTLPVDQYAHSAGCSVSGGYVYRGDRWPEFVGTYFYGDYCSGSIWGLSSSDPGSGSTRVMATNHQISSFGVNRSGEILVVDHTGRLLKLQGT
jgi:glucose/arabinose dehydrogenase